MKSSFASLCLVLSTLPLLLCPGAAQTVATGKSTIAGEVINAFTSNPIPGTRVVLLNEAEAEAGPSQVVRALKANASGRFRLSVLQPGKYILKASRSGFLEYEGTSITVTSGQRLENFTIKLSPQGVVTGVILQEDGDPYTGALVSAVPVDSVRGATYAYSNDLGEYRLFGLPPGKYWIHASHRGIRASTYYPHAATMEDAVPVEVAAGSLLTGIDLTAWSSMADAGEHTGSGSAGGTEPTSAGAATIEGQVINPLTGAPVPRAHIALERGADDHEDSEKKFDAVADASGYFSLQDLQPGSYHLSAGRKGFVAARHGVEEFTVDLTLDTNQSIKDVTLELTPTGVITGKAIGEDGDPLANAVVMALSSTFNRGRRAFFVARRVYTNDLGEYRLYDLPSGQYYVTALYRAGWDHDDSANVNYPPIYYPNAVGLTDATPLRVRPGDVLNGINLAFSNLTPVHVRGRATVPSAGLSGGAKAGSAISVYLTPAELSMARRYSRRGVDANTTTGEFELRGVPAGAYILTAEWADEGKQYSAARTINIGKTDIDGLVLSLRPEARLSGQLRLETKDNFNYSGLQVSLDPAKDAAVAFGSHGTVDQSGSFGIENLRPGQYSVSLSGLNANYYLKAVYYHGKNVTQSGIDVSQDDAGGLELVLSPDGGGIEGTVLSKDQESAPVNAAIVLVPETGLGEGRELYKAVMADPAGKFSLKGIAPGRYTILASDDLDSAQELITLDHLGESVTIEENRTAKIQLNVVQGEDY